MSDTEVIVRRAQLQDLPAILAIDRMSPSATHWGEPLYRNILAHTPESPGPHQRLALVAELSGAISGFTVASATRYDGDTTVELESIVVGLAWQRQGIGRRLCHGILAWASDLGAAAIDLEVRASSPARILYASLRFTVIGRRPDYYRNPSEDALLMRLCL